jgi:hypothetical protein
MFMLLYSLFGLLLFDCFVASCLYFRKERFFDTYEEQLDYLRTVKFTEHCN